MPGPVWRLNPLVELHWKSWGPTWLVFEAVSGDAGLLGCFDTQPLNLAQAEQALAAALGAEAGTPPPALPRDELLAALTALVSRGWLDSEVNSGKGAGTGTDMDAGMDANLGPA
jgi:hypothetical protein